MYLINSRLTTVTADLGPDATAAASGTSYEILHRFYTLPDDFGGMVSDSFTYRRDEQWHLPQIKSSR